jgi:hypothetical protein
VHLSRKAGQPQSGQVLRCGFCATPSAGVHSRREAQVIPCASRIHPRYSAPRASGLVQFRN